MRSIIKNVLLGFIFFIPVVAHMVFMCYERGDMVFGGEWLIYSLVMFAYLKKVMIHD